MAVSNGVPADKFSSEPGKPTTPEMVDEALATGKYDLITVTHNETSTGVMNPAAEIGALLKGREILYVLDVVTSLGGIPVKVDEWGIDCCYSGTQKCLSVPPGLSPITFSDKAMAVIAARKTKVQNWYLDVTLLQKYWGNSERVYHHTAPITMIYGIYEGLRIIAQEGLENRWARHQRVSDILCQGLAELGFTFFAQEGYRLPELIAVFPPVADQVEPLRKRLLNEYNIEVGAGLGPVAGKIWRIGLMGETCEPRSVSRLLDALRRLL